MEHEDKSAAAFIGMVLALAIVLLSGCAGTEVGNSANFARCLANERGCDESRLTALESSRLVKVQADRHFEDCMARMRCNESLLSGPQRVKVRESVRRINFNACMRGEAGCAPGLLGEDEVLQVQRAQRDRNIQICMAGLVGCALDELDPAERTAMIDAYRERNFRGCMNAVGTLLSCNPDDLDAQQREKVQRRNLEVNFFLCANNAFGCDVSLLNADERLRIEKEGKPDTR